MAGWGNECEHKQPKIVRVIPDIAAISKTFDYLVPESWKYFDKPVSVGTRVRIELHARRVGAWVVELDPEDHHGLDSLQPLKLWSGLGPSQEIIDLAHWAAKRWVSTPAKLLSSASPPRKISRLPKNRAVAQPGPTQQRLLNKKDTEQPMTATERLAKKAFKQKICAIEIAPSANRWPFVLEAIKRANPLIIAPRVTLAKELVTRLRSQGYRAHFWPDGWAESMIGTITVATRAGSLASISELGSILILDEHDETLRSQQSPTYHAVELTLERAIRSDISWVALSSAISPLTRQLLQSRDAQVISAPAVINREGWPQVEIVDRSAEPPGRRGLFSSPLARIVKDRSLKVACILNRSDRVRLLGCLNCNQIVACEVCSAAVALDDERNLCCRRCGTSRPELCANCGSVRLKNIILGIGKAREELEALVGEAVCEHRAKEILNPGARVSIGTEALLRTAVEPNSRYNAIIFLDFDQHLFAMRANAELDALALLSAASRHLGPRSRRGRLVIQTNSANHRIFEAVKSGSTESLSKQWLEEARQMRWWPTWAEAEISGTAAAAFIDNIDAAQNAEDHPADTLFETEDQRLNRIEKVEDLIVLETGENLYKLRSQHPEKLTALLAGVQRPKGRLRIAVL